MTVFGFFFSLLALHSVYLVPPGIYLMSSLWLLSMSRMRLGPAGNRRNRVIDTQ